LTVHNLAAIDEQRMHTMEEVSCNKRTLYVYPNICFRKKEKTYEFSNLLRVLGSIEGFVLYIVSIFIKFDNVSKT
jgi:hypothetical protein